MNRIIMAIFISGLTGCQGTPSTSLTANKLSTLSNEDLCRALGTYNNDGELILKIYDTLKKRPEKISPERCYILEKTNKKLPTELEENDARINTSYSDNLNTPPSHVNNDTYQHIDSQHHKIIHNPRKHNKNNEINTNTLQDINSLSRMSTYKNELPTRKLEKDKIDIKENEMGKIMRECLKKHISNSKLNSNE